MTIGKMHWAIAEGYIPPDDPEKPREFISHEVACLLNTTDQDARIRLMVYFTDREPAGPYQINLRARRTLHLRFNDLDDPEPVPRAVDYASTIESDVPIVVQHTRLDARKGGNALLTTIAYSEP
jgi:hypothetical protein